MKNAKLIQMQTDHILIEKGVPLPDKRGGKWGFLARMEKGDSVLLPNVGRATLSANLSTYGNRLNRKFATRQTPDKQHVRVWRIA